MSTFPLYAIRARALHDERRRGLMPTSPVIVSMLDDGVAYARPVLLVKPDMAVERLDWSMLVNLEVWVWAAASEPLERVTALVRAIAKVKPCELVLRFEERRGVVHDVLVGTGCHHAGAPEHGIAPEHSFTFCPVNAAGSPIGERLRTALQRVPHGAFA